jgi:spermidine/putrescine transport system permease protein
MLIGNLIKNQFLTSRDWPFGAALSIVLIVITLALILVNSKAIGKNSDLEVF